MADFKLKQTGTQTQTDLDWVDSIKDNLTQDEDITEVNGSLEVSDDLMISGIDKLTNTQGSQLIKANPTNESSTTLKKLKVGDTIYAIEGQEIEANPSESSTSNLSKLKVVDTIYAVLSVKSWDETTGTLYLE